MAIWRRWTDADDQRLVDLANAGDSTRTIAGALVRSRSAVTSRAVYLRAVRGADALPAKLGDSRIDHAPVRGKGVKTGGRGEQKRRVCLSCGNPFLSAHSMNRLCDYCRRQSASPYAP